MASTAPSVEASAVDARQLARRLLRTRLLADRVGFAGRPQAPPAHDALAAHLARLLRDIEPGQLGVYWPIRSEFNAITALEAAGPPKLRLALPFATRLPPEMHYRAWDGRTPTGIDECGLPAPSEGPVVVPDVILVPCVGYTRSGFRLGYGAGYFDRWLEQHPQTTAIGIAWSIGEISDEDFAPQAHDLPMRVVLTEQGVVV